MLFACTATLAAASDALIDTIVVKFRGDDALADVQALPTGHRFVVGNALRTGIIEIGRTKDGAFRLALEPALPFDAAQAAINRLRLDAQILYAQTAARADPSQRARVHVKAGTKDDLPLHRIIVKYRDAALRARAAAELPLPQSRLDTIAATAGVAAGHERVLFDGSFLVRLFRALPRADVERAAEALALDPDVEYAEPDYRAFIAIAPNDTLYANQWHYYEAAGGVNLTAAWNRTTGSASIRVAVVDTGYLAHPDLASRFIGGYDFIYDYIVANDGSPAQPGTCTPTSNPLSGSCTSSRDGDASDPGDWITASEDAGTTWNGWLQGCGVSNSSWHGTHVAGTIGAITNNASGVAGVNWMSPIVPVRVLGKCGGYSSDIADGIVWASGGTVSGVPANANPARVLNVSIGGGGGCGATYQNAINGALSRNTVVVVSAGNGNQEASLNNPGNCNGVITVAATGRQGQRASYSNYDNNDGSGVQVEIAAPGGSDGQTVLSTLNNGTTTPNPAGFNYVGYNGTSMAAPHVAGIASLMLSVNPSLTPAQVLSAMQTTARPFPTGTIRDCTSNLASVTSAVKYCGAGIIDADAAIAAISSSATTTVLSSSLNPSAFGQTVTFTATVTGTAPTGTVSFTANSAAIGGCTSVALAGAGNVRTAQCATAGLAAGAHSIGASYSGDGSNAPSSATPLAQSVTSAPLPPLKQRDFNANNRGDVLWRSNIGDGHAIWLMNGGTPTASANIGAPADWLVTHTADFNNDGRHDLILRNQVTGTTSMWLMNGTSLVSGATLIGDPNWTMLHTGDFNGDGNQDLVWFNAAANTTSIWLMNGTTLIGAATMLVAPNWTVTHVADFNGDGKDDLVWRNAATGETAMWLLNGTTFAGGSIILASTAWSVVRTGDFNGDGKADLVWRNATTGQISLWLMNGNAMTAGAIVLSDPNWSPTHTADFDGDGRSDLVWRNSATGATSVWLMNGLAMSAGASVTLTGSVVIATGDYDGDGRSDLLWYEAFSGLTQIRLMNGTAMGPSLPLFTGSAWSPRP